MKVVRNIVIILAVIFILLFIFAGKGIFDDVIPATQVKGAILLALHSKDIVDNGKYGIMVRKDGGDLFFEKMKEDGYALETESEGSFSFVKEDKKTTYGKRNFLGCWLFEEMKLAGEKTD